MPYKKEKNVLYWITPSGKKIPVGVFAPNESGLYGAKSARKVVASFQKIAYGYSCVQCSLPREIADEIYEWGLQNIPDEDLAADGRESDIHVTVKYGLHGHDPFELRDFLFGKEPIKIKLGRLSLFCNDEHDVVKLEVDSPELHQFNKLVSDNFEHTDTHPDYIPHVTVAYVKKGLGKKYEDRDDFAGRQCLLDSVTFSGNDNRMTVLPIG